MKTLAVYGLICVAIQKGIVLGSSLSGVSLDTLENINRELDKYLLDFAQYIISIW
jgi:hypothetical protein